MIRNFLPLLAMTLVATPLAAEASVRINEVAWMGTLENANAEWIELYNQGGEPIALDGWTLISSTLTPSITLSGTLLPDTFLLLMRTNVNNVAGVTGDLAYTGALSNAGVTLTLRNAVGEVIDEVAGGNNWEQIGGDNVTKKTPQRGVGGWVTATPTPRAPNAEILGETETEEEPETATTTQVTVGGTGVSTSVPASLPKLYIVAGPHRTVATGAETQFEAFVFGEDKKYKRYADITWAFGDGGSDTGSRVAHGYKAEGMYLVVVRARTEAATAVTTLMVEAHDAPVTIEEVTPEGVRIVNTSDTYVDLSLWHLKVKGKRYTFPRDTMLLPYGSVLIPHEISKLSYARAPVELLYPQGTLAHVFDVGSVPILSERIVAP